MFTFLLSLAQRNSTLGNAPLWPPFDVCYDLSASGTVVPPIPSVDRLPHITAADFQVLNMFFLGYIRLPLPPFSNTDVLSPVPRAAVLGGRLYLNHYTRAKEGRALLFSRCYGSVKLAVFRPIPWNRQSTREIRFFHVKFRFSLPEISDLKYNSLRASIPSTWRTDVLGFQSAQSPKSQNQAASARETLYPITCNHETGEIYSGKPGFPEYDVREIASIWNL